MRVHKHPKRVYSSPREVVDYFDRLLKAPTDELAAIIRELDVWRFSKGDLNAWISVLDKLDEALERIANSYDLSKPQINPFTPKDRELVLECLRMFRLLLDNNMSRKLFSSYDRCYDLLLSSDLEVVHSALLLLHRPAHQYLGGAPIDKELLPKLLQRIQTLARADGIVAFANGETEDKLSVTYYKTSSTTVDLDMTLDEADQLHSLDLPVNDHLAAYMLLQSKFGPDRALQVNIRLVALATHILYSPTSSLDDTLFLYEPDLVSQIAGLIPRDEFCASSIMVLDAFARHKSKIAEVLSAININVNHGVLLNLLRSIPQRSMAVIDALFTFLSILIQTPNHANIMVGAGALSVMLEILVVEGERRISVIPRACGIIDVLIYRNPQGLSMFSNVDGANTLVARIKDEVDTGTVPSYPLLDEEAARTYSMAPLKSLIRAVHRVMQSSGGTQGLRNLVDGELPKSLKRIFQGHRFFGTRVFAQAIMTMTTFINNEPTSLSILQELQLPQTLYAQLDPVPPTIESAVANAISAICLNAAGLELTKANPQIITSLITASMASDETEPSHTGASLEELARHQQSLRATIENAVLVKFCHVCAAGDDFEPNAEQIPDYKLDKIRSDGIITMPINDGLVQLSRMLRFLEGFLSNATSAANLIKSNLLTLLLGTIELSCIPIRFASTEASAHLTHVFRLVGSHDHVKLSEALCKSIHDDLATCPTPEQWTAFNDGTMDPVFVVLKHANTRISQLTDVINGLAGAHTRVNTSILKELGRGETLARIGALLKSVLVQHAGLKLPSKDDKLESDVSENGKESGAKYLATRLYTSITRFLRAVNRLFVAKRHPDALVSPEAKVVAKAMARIMAETFSVVPLPDKRIATLNQALAFNAALLFEDREGYGALNLTLFSEYDFNPLLATGAALIAEQKVELLLLVLLAITSSGPLLSSPQLASVENPAELLIRARHLTFAMIHEIWTAPWLTELPADSVKRAAKAFLGIMSGEKEEAVERPVVVRAPAPRRIERVAVTANAALIEQLAEMGFSRGGAELALIRTHNNIAAATELILSQPHIFADLPDPAPAPEAAPAAAPEAQAEAPAADADAAVDAPDTATAPAADAAPEAAAEPTEDAAAPASDMEIDATPTIDHRAELTTLRKEYKDAVPARALELLDHMEELVFVVAPAFSSGDYVVEQIRAALPYDSSKEAMISARLRLLVVLLQKQKIGLEVNLLCALPLEPSAKWASALLLLGENMLTASTKITESKIGDESKPILEVASLGELPDRLLQLSLSIVAQDEVERTPLLTALRTLVLLSRGDHVIPHDKILAAFRKPSNRLKGCQPLLALILRHAFEEKSTLNAVMRREIATWGNTGKVADLNHFVRQLKQVAWRSPTDFVDAADAECKLVDPAPQTAIFHISTRDNQDAKEADPFTAPAPAPAAAGVIDLLLSELQTALVTMREDNNEDTLKYTNLLVSLLTELVGSYMPAKVMLLSALRSKGISLIGEMTQRLTDTPESARCQVTRWMTYLIVGLCSDIGPTKDIKNVHEDLVTARKTILDSITKAFKESTTDLDARYGRLSALGTLSHKLLTARSAPGRQDESGTHMAKIMIEKSLVGTLTSATGEVDLNYPGVSGVLTSLLGALDYLSQISIKWGKADKDKTPEGEESSDESESDSEMDVDVDETPDLYRNSALGMLGNDMEDSDDEEEEDEDDILQYEEEAMDDMDDSGTEGTEDSDVDMSEEDDWTDEDGEDVDDEGEPIIEREVILAPPGDDEEEEEAILEGWEEDDGMDPGSEEDYGEEDYDDEDMMDPLEYDELGEMFDHPEMYDPQPSQEVGAWGWTTASRPRRLDTEQTAMFGVAALAPSHPLLAPPNEQPRLVTHPRIADILRNMHTQRTPVAIAALDALMQNSRPNQRVPVEVEAVDGNPNAVDLRIAGQTYTIETPAAPEPDITTEFQPRQTSQRWLEEYNILPGQDDTEAIARLVMHVANRLMPEAKRVAEEEAKKREEEERVAQAKAEAERVEREKEEEEERLAAAERARLAEAPNAAEVPLPESRASDTPVPGDVEMAEPTLARTIIQIHGEDVDITDTGIDLEFLQALPDEMRAEVVEQHLREQGRPAPRAAAPAAANELNADFLDALPPEIRAEVLMQEALSNARNRNAPAGPPAGVGAGRRAVDALLEGMPDMEDVLGDEILDGLQQILGGARQLGRPRMTIGRPRKEDLAATRPHREALQLLDKHGIASLVRLLFFPGSTQERHLYQILVNLCENSTTRSDLLNLLLSVVEDGSGDLLAVDRSFQQMSIKAMATPKVTPKRATVVVPETPAAPVFSHLQAEHVPAFIAQRCFDALMHIVGHNAYAGDFFLTEHEQGVGLRKATSKKGKGKEKEKVLPQIKFPIVILLGLLDRPVLLRTSAMMESLTGLLSLITRPLATLKPEPTPETTAAPVPATASSAQATPAPAAPAAEAGPSTVKPLTLTKPPTIPPNVLRLVVNCLTGECPSRTFSNSVSLMRHLSASAESKEAIVGELRSRCDSLGKSLFVELDELVQAIRSSDADTAMAKFTPPSSSQAQLLRMLKTIDYLHGHGRERTDTPQPGDQEVGEIFKSFEFAGMWERLGTCLGVVEEKGSTEQIATALLPLVEALMVICKYDTETGGLFVPFTTSHRKVLNAIVRNNPSLLSGSFSLLVRNPRVLEFDNKRNWFFQQLKRKKDQPVGGALTLNVRRQYVFEDSFHSLQRRSGEEIKYGRLNVKFVNEDGIDATGLTREWYSVLAKQIFDPNFALFEPCAADQQTYQINKGSYANPDHLSYLKFVGRVIGKSIYDGRLLDAYFSRAFYKQILGRAVDMRDLEGIDPEFHKSLQWMLENDITGIIDQEFVVEERTYGADLSVPLKDGGETIPVTEENKAEYVQLVTSHRLQYSIKDQIKAFLDGFYEIIPQQLVQIFEPDQLELLISGITTIDVDELKNASQLAGFKSTDPEINWLWRALRSFSQEERSRFLMFVTSSSRVPLGGFTQLQGASGVQPMQVQKLHKDGGLPQASTCFNLLLLPTYESYEQLRDRLVFAMTETSGFGKA